MNKADDNQLRRLAEPAFAAARSGILEHALNPAFSPSEATERGVEIEMAYYPKLLLISAFCASHNPVSTDKRYFSRHGSGRTKQSHRTQQGQGAAGAASHVPHVFTMERWIKLFQALLAGNDYRNNGDGSNSGGKSTGGKYVAKIAFRNLQGQMLNLEECRLVQRMSSHEELDVVKFRCLAGLRCVAAVAAKLDIDLGKYLHSS